MIATLERINDGIAIAKTDRRVWAATGFLVLVFSFWVATGSWREEPPESEKRIFIPKPKEEDIREPIRSMASVLEERKRERAELHEVIKRTENDLATGKQEIDWHVNNLLDRLNDMGNRIDKLAKDVGDRAIEKNNFEKKIKPASKKHMNVYKPVDRSSP